MWASTPDIDTIFTLQNGYSGYIKACESLRNIFPRTEIMKIILIIKYIFKNLMHVNKKNTTVWKN